MKKYGLILIALMVLFLVAAVPSDASTTVYKKTALTGGGGTALDGIDGAGLAASDMAFTTVSSVVYVHILDASNNSAESSPAIIAPDTNPGVKRWILQNTTNSSQDVSPNTIWGSSYTGTGALVRSGGNIGAATGTSVSVSGDVSGATIHQGSRGLIAGDTTAGRVLKVISLSIQYANGANDAKFTILSLFNGDVFPATDVSKNATAGNFTLSAAGTRLTIEAAGLTGNVVGIGAFGLNWNNSALTGTQIDVNPVSNDIAVDFFNSSGIALDITTIGSGKTIICNIMYFTSQ